MPGGKREPLSGHRSCSDRTLPVRRHKDRIVQKINDNRVILICADTGSGKSSQVPQMILEEGMGPILCTQPRRLAVVSVAKRVAYERGCELGTEVGYQIGQVNLSTTRSQIVFKTAGILFEELRVNGSGALSRFKVVILDEVHERSVESDLVLTCMKQLLRSTVVKLVLMSATADLLKYEEYFKEIDKGEGVEKIAIQNNAERLQSVILNTKVVYLDQVISLLGNGQHQGIMDAMNENFSPVESGINIGSPTHNLIKDLIVSLHLKEEDLTKSVLVFLPTYKALEVQWSLMAGARQAFQLYVLHSSIDMEHSIRAMEACPCNRRKVILSTNVAESSLTIPGVAFVIDSCRSLEICWDREVKQHVPRIVWVSESQATQRKGRTGRTCDGVVYRLVPRNHFSRFEKFEAPAIQLLSLRKQVLVITCSSSKALNDPPSLLRKCMNPPKMETVLDALGTLQYMKAVETDSKGKHQATLYGQLLASLPLSLEAAMLVVKGGQLGYPQESAVLAAILDSTPRPIIKPFANPFLYQLNLEKYYKPSDLEGRPSQEADATMLSNLYAYEFWQLCFKDRQRAGLLLQRGRRFSQASRKFEDEEFEIDWCWKHGLSLTALQSVAETAYVVIEALHRFRPKFMNDISGPPSYVRAGISFSHSCLTPSDGRKIVDTSDSWDDWSFQESEQSMINGNNGNNGNNGSCGAKADSSLLGNIKAGGQSPRTCFALPHDEGHSVDLSDSCNDWSFQESEPKKSHENNASGENNEPQTCPSIPYTCAGSFHSVDDEEILSGILTQVQRGEQSSIVVVSETLGDQLTKRAPLCSFFQKGICTKGDQCLYSHSPLATPMVCRFISSPKGCLNGSNCRFSHDVTKRYEPINFDKTAYNEPINFDEVPACAQSMVDLIPVMTENELLLLFGEGDFSFADSLLDYVNPENIFATSLDKEEVLLGDPGLELRLKKLMDLQVQVMWDVDVTALASSHRKDTRLMANSLMQAIPWARVRCILWNFPFTNFDESSAKHHDLMQRFFSSLSIIMLSQELEPIPVIITLCNDQYCRWQVERAARHSFFFMTTSVPFDVSTFGGYHPVRNNLKSTFLVERPLTYVFQLHVPGWVFD